MITCPRCGGQNRAGARFCRLCGFDLSSRQPSPPAGGPLTRLLRTVRHWVSGTDEARPAPGATRRLAGERPSPPPSAPLPPPLLARPLRPAHGQATHPGRKRERNEDGVVTFTYDKEQADGAVPVGFFLVADGMGGHEAGDVASRAVSQIVADWIIKAQVLPDLRQATQRLNEGPLPAEMLVHAIQQTNEVLRYHGQAGGSDLGSTVTAALIVGDAATVANVGDSRTYLLRNGRLEQITQDHSLVARLVAAGALTPAEARTHPQRNRIYRGLGQQPTVEVDTFTVQLQRGDRLILCSDGLWEMVPDEEIRTIVQGARSPQKACDALVEAANRAGGEDNISVIVVEME